MRTAGGSITSTPLCHLQHFCAPPAAAEQRAEAQEKVGHPFTVTPNKQILYDLDMGADATHSIISAPDALIRADSLPCSVPGLAWR